MSYEAWGDGDPGPDWRDDALEHGWIDPVDVSRAMLDVMNERDRQQNEEGWTPEHDDEHRLNELGLAAAAYAFAGRDGKRPWFWPWSPEWWKPSDRRRNLVKAGALILAEIERLDRLADTPPQAEGGREDG